MYSKESIDTSKQCACWWKGDLMRSPFKRVGVTGWHVWLTWLTMPKMPENTCKTVTARVRQLINLQFPLQHSLKPFSHSWSSWRIALGEFDCSRAVAKGILERLVPVILV